MKLFQAGDLLQPNLDLLALTGDDGGDIIRAFVFHRNTALLSGNGIEPLAEHQAVRFEIVFDNVDVYRRVRVYFASANGLGQI